jgi:hypothetical protein
VIEVTLRLDDDEDAELIREALRHRSRVLVETAHPRFGWRHVGTRMITAQLKEHDHE